MAARQGHGAVGRLPARGGAGAAAAPLPVHRQRPRRGHPGQAAGGGGDRRSPDAAADPRRELGRAARARGGWSTSTTRRRASTRAALRTCCAGGSSSAAEGLGLDRDLGIGRELGDRRALAPPGQPSVRAQGAADPRRPARVRPVARRLACSPTCWWRWLRPPRGAARAATRRCCARWRHDLALDWDPLGANLAEPWAGPRPAGLRRSATSLAHRRRHGRAAGAAGARGWSRGERTGGAGLDGNARRCWPRSTAGCGRRSAGCGRLELAGLLAGSTAGAWRRGRAARRRAGGPRCCRPGAISTRSTAAPCRRRRPGSWAGTRPRWCVEQYLQQHGDWPRQVALSAWGTANMRTGGDDIAQALALMGCRPVWDRDSRRVTGVEVLPLGGPRPAAGRRHACASPASSATPSRPRSSCSTMPCRAVAGAGRARGRSTRWRPRPGPRPSACRRPGLPAAEALRRAAAAHLRQPARAPTVPGCRR